MMDDEEYITADIPDEFKGLRACLRCSLIKTFEQVLTLPNLVIHLINYIAIPHFSFSLTIRDVRIVNSLIWKATRVE